MTMSLRYTLFVVVSGDFGMSASQQEKPKRSALNLRISVELRGLIDQAARLVGKNRTDFVLDAARKAARQARQREARAWNEFVDRARRGQIDPIEDVNFLREVEELAYGRRSASRLLSELGRPARPETAHALLLETGYWDMYTNPYPVRLRLPVASPELELPPLPDEPRLDLTRLAAYAIDDRDNRDPDDAISLEAIQVDAAGNLLSGRLWVHVADAAALLPPDSPADLEARGRGATLYLPEGPVTLLPAGAVNLLGLGLQEVSPALSFGLTLDARGEITASEIHPSWVKVQRLSYEQADEQHGAAERRPEDRHPEACRHARFRRIPGPARRGQRVVVSEEGEVPESDQDKKTRRNELQHDGVDGNAVDEEENSHDSNCDQLNEPSHRPVGSYT